MIILKHGKLKEGARNELYGKCKFCGCAFETYVDIFRNVSEDADYVFRTDADCLDMKIEPDWVYSDNQIWKGYTTYLTRVLRSVDYSVPCPECRAIVNLKIKNTFKFE